MMLKSLDHAKQFKILHKKTVVRVNVKHNNLPPSISIAKQKSHPVRPDPTLNIPQPHPKSATTFPHKLPKWVLAV